MGWDVAKYPDHTVRNENYQFSKVEVYRAFDAGVYWTALRDIDPTILNEDIKILKSVILFIHQFIRYINLMTFRICTHISHEPFSKKQQIRLKDSKKDLAVLYSIYQTSNLFCDKIHVSKKLNNSRKNLH